MIRRLRPNIVLGHDPWKRYRLHPDHRHAGLLAVEGVVAARDPHFFPELAWPTIGPTSCCLFEPEVIDHVETVSGFEQHKLAALEAHRASSSRRCSSPMANADELDRFRSDATRRQWPTSAPSSTPLGEGYKRISAL